MQKCDSDISRYIYIENLFESINEEDYLGNMLEMEKEIDVRIRYADLIPKLDEEEKEEKLEEKK